MADLRRFQELVTIYRKRQDTPAGKPHTQQELADAIGLSADELGHRLRGTGRSPLTQDNIRAIVHTLAQWGTLIWDEVVELLVCMDYPLDPPDWLTNLERVLGPAPRSVHQIIASLGASPGAEPPVPIRRRLFQAPDRLKGYVPRPNVFNEIKRLLLAHEENQTTAITTALRGAGGFGKTALATALCHDSDIQEAFPNGILWVELGENPPPPLAVLTALLHALEPSVREEFTLEVARVRWRHAMEGPAYLLVIDDVWQREALEELLKGGTRCGRLITTRNDQILPDAAKRVWVDAMEPDEAMELLCKGWGEDWQHALERSVLEQVVVQQLGRWPLLVTLARGTLTTQVKRLGKTPEQALAQVHRAYQDRGMAAFHLGDQIERQRSADACVEVNLRQLEQWVPPHYQARQRYLELAIFPEGTDIPLTTLQTYWQATGELQTFEVEQLCLHLSDLSLLLPWDGVHRGVRLHDVLRRYLVEHARSQLSTLHGRLLNAYQQHYRLTTWADLPRSEAYLWHHLVYHLCQAGHQEALRTTLTDIHYLINKVLYVSISELKADLAVGISELEADLAVSISELKTDLALASPQSFAQASFPPVAELYRYIERFGYLLFRFHTFAEVSEILLNYLPKELATEDQRRVLEGEYARPFLAPWYPLPNRVSSLPLSSQIRYFGRALSCAVSPDGRFIVSGYENGALKIWDSTTGAEFLTLTGHIGPVYGCAVSPDGRFIVSASSDRTLKIRDIATGAERFTIHGHTNEVNSCAVSPDGRWIISASSDRTLKIWDAATGAERLTLTGHTSGIWDCAVSPDGRFIVSASWDCTLKVWDAATGAERLTLIGHDAPVLRCAVSPDGRFIVSASYDHTVKVWDAATGAERLTLTGHINVVMGCAVSPDGRFIVSAAWDCDIKVWDATSGECLFTFPGEDELYGCAFHPDREHLVICGTLGMYFLRLVS